MHIHHFEEQGGDGPYDMEEPNFFGLSIGYDPLYEGRWWRLTL